MEQASPLSRWRVRLAAAYWVAVVLVYFFGDDHGFLLALATLPWFFVLGFLFMLWEFTGIRLGLPDVVEQVLLFAALVVVGGGLNAAWIAGILGRTRHMFLKAF